MRIGVDLGGTKIEAQLLDADGHCLWRQRNPTPRNDYPATIEAIARLVEQAETEFGPCASIGICIPGTLSPDHGRVKNANSTWLIGQPLDQDLSERLQRPVKLANDADCFALSEATDGAGQGARSVFGVILGTGVGGGIVFNGQLLSGPNAIAGEWGHNPLPWLDPEKDPALACYCGKHGCIETFLSGPGLSQHHALLSQQPAISAEQVIAEQKAGDSIASQAFALYCDRLARGLASVINILDPEVIVLGGGLSNIDALYQSVPQLWQRYVFSDRVNTQLRPARHGDASGVRGAAWLK